MASLSNKMALGRTGSVLTLDTGDARTSPDQLPQGFAKFFSSKYHVALSGAGDADEVKR
jgi:hypothetical protein